MKPKLSIGLWEKTSKEKCRTMKLRHYQRALWRWTGLNLLLWVLSENTDVIPITVNDLHGELYLSKDFEQRDNTVFWIDEELNICFDISGFYSATDILHIAESVSLSKTTK